MCTKLVPPYLLAPFKLTVNCLRREPESKEPKEPLTMEDGSTKKILTMDRAAFLLLRVKKIFKKKREQRKDRK